MKESIKFKRQIHQGYKTNYNVFHKYHYTYKDLFSIVGPSIVTHDLWELYDNKDIFRFDSLKKAKRHANKLFNKNICKNQP